MARTGVKMEEVFEACNKITNSGVNPTIEKIRLMLGQKGSYTTISKYMNLWKTKNIKIKKKTKEYHQGFADALRQIKNLINTLG